ISDIPWDGPIVGIRVGRLNGEFVVFPTVEEIEKCDMDLVVACSRDAIVMVEGGAAEATENDLIEALMFAHKGAQPVLDLIEKLLKAEFEERKAHVVRSYVLKDGKRMDGRDTRTIRPIMTEAGLLPRVHGSALFQRGETQAIVTTTLGTSTDEQKIDGLNGERWKRFLLHYNFPPFSTGETKPMRGPGRREVGHGA